MYEPKSEQEWQDAVDTAHVMLLIDSATKYGLVRGGPKIDVARCEDVLARGKALGYEPAEDAPERLVGIKDV